MYESWFHLSKRPFGAAPQVADYCPSESIELARKNIVRCIEGSAGPSILIGGPGSGKSTLCLKIREQYQEAMPTGYFSCCGIHTRRELLQQILFAFGQPYDASDEGTLRISLTHFVHSQEETNVILLIDDVDDLPAELFEELRSLSNLTRDGDWCINLVLIGKSKLEELLGRPGMESLEQRIASRNYLHKWNAAATAEYVRFQISRAGGNADEIFSEEAFEQVYRTTDGLPRLVNQVCDHAMIMAGLGSVQQLDGIHIEEAWADLQQLPPPKRSNGDEPAQQESVIEFGTLDDSGSDVAWDSEVPTTECESPFDESGAHNQQDFEPPLEQANNLDPFGSLGADDKAALDDDFETVFDDSIEISQMPMAETEGSAEPVIEQGFEESPNCDKHQSPNCDKQEQEPRLADSSHGDLVDRLDDIEREVQRVSTELHGESPSQLPYDSDICDPQPTSSTSNPFLEVFDEEEIVFGTHNTMNNELVRRQPAVFTPGGEALIDVIRMVDRGNDPKDWERLDNITGSQPADGNLTLELATTPFLQARQEPEIAEANTSGAEFAASEFSLNYAASINQDTDDQSNADDSVVLDTIETDRETEVSVNCENRLEDDLAPNEPEATEFPFGIANDSEPFAEVCDTEEIGLFEDGVCGSEVGTEHPPLGEELTMEIMTTSGVPLDEPFTHPSESLDDRPITVAIDSGDVDTNQLGPGTPFVDEGNSGDESGTPQTADEQSDAWNEPEPIEQTMILPQAPGKPFSNNTGFGEQTDESEGNELSASRSDEPDALRSTPKVASSDRTELEATAKPPKRFSKLFSQLKSTSSE